MIIPIDEFFKKMRLSEEEIKRREDLADDLFYIFQVIFWEMSVDHMVNNVIDSEYYKDLLYRRYCEEVEDYVVIVAALLEDEVMSKLETDIQQHVSDIIDTTIKNIDTDFFTSDDRATELGENETNYVGNNTDYINAEHAGYTKKIWLTMKDDRVRDSHFLVDNKVIGIDEYYKVGQAEMLFPMDMSRNAYEYPDEWVNCRCVVQYIK